MTTCWVCFSFNLPNLSPTTTLWCSTINSYMSVQLNQDDEERDDYSVHDNLGCCVSTIIDPLLGLISASNAHWIESPVFVVKFSHFMLSSSFIPVSKHFHKNLTCLLQRSWCGTIYSIIHSFESCTHIPVAAPFERDSLSLLGPFISDGYCTWNSELADSNPNRNSSLQLLKRHLKAQRIIYGTRLFTWVVVAPWLRRWLSTGGSWVRLPL